MTTSVSTKREFVVCCDIRKSIALLFWDGKKLDHKAEDTSRIQILSSDIFESQGGSILILASDKNRNIILFSFIMQGSIIRSSY